MVDDDQGICNLYQFAFSVENIFAFIIASDYQSGIEAIERLQPQLVILDLILPRDQSVAHDIEQLSKENGFTLLAKIREREETRRMPVIILSNLGDKADILRARKFGVQKYFIKSNILPKDIVNEAKKYLSKN